MSRGGGGCESDTIKKNGASPALKKSLSWGGGGDSDNFFLSSLNKILTNIYIMG